MSSQKPLVLFFNPVKHAHAQYQLLQQVARTEVVTSQGRDEFFKDLQTKYKDAFAIYRTSASGMVSCKTLVDVYFQTPSYLGFFGDTNKSSELTNIFETGSWKF